MTAVDPEGRIRHPLDVFHSTLMPDGSFIPAGFVPVADGAGLVDYVDSAALAGATFYNVADYGAVGDGSTNDTTAITDTFDAADATGGGIIYFPPTADYYKITSLITRTGTSKYHLYGGGSRHGPARIHQATANTGVFKFAPSSGTINRDKTPLIESLVISGAGGASSGRGLEFDNDCHLRDVLVAGFYDGVYLTGASYYSYIGQSTFTDCDHAGLYLDGTNNTTIDACRFTGQWGSGTGLFGALQYGIYVVCPFPTGLNTKIINSSIEYFYADGIYGAGLYGVEISGNYFESQQSSSGHAHINLGPANSARAVFIHGNYFQGDGTSGFDAIKGTTTDRITVQSNYFGINGAIGISASGGGNANWLVVNNYNSPAGTFSLPASSYELDPANPPTPGAPTTADYLVGTSNGSLSAEIVVGTSPGGELGGSWASPTVDSTHSGSAHSDFIAKALVDAKGDLIAATAADTVARVAVGTDGQYLKADSGASAGVSWASLVSPTDVWVVDPGGFSYDASSGDVVVSRVSKFGITSGGAPYYNAANVTSGDEAALVWDSTAGAYALRRYS